MSDSNAAGRAAILFRMGPTMSIASNGTIVLSLPHSSAFYRRRHIRVIIIMHKRPHLTDAGMSAPPKTHQQHTRVRRFHPHSKRRAQHSLQSISDQSQASTYHSKRVAQKQCTITFELPKSRFSFEVLKPLEWEPSHESTKVEAKRISTVPKGNGDFQRNFPWYIRETFFSTTLTCFFSGPLP